MRSDSLSILRSQGLGIACGLATVLLLAVGSVIIAATRDTASAGVQADDVTWFFTHPSPWHAWFYLLVPVLCMYALNTLLSTWHHMVRMWRLGNLTTRDWAPVVFHAAFLVALLAHGVGGLWGQERGVIRLGPMWRDIPGGSEARVVRIDESTHPDGHLKQAVVTLDIRDPNRGESQVQVSYNGPVTTGWGVDLLLMVNHRIVEHHGTTFPTVLLRSRHAPGNPVALIATVLIFLGVLMMGRRWL